jgi:hypothetical protein
MLEVWNRVKVKQKSITHFFSLYLYKEGLCPSSGDINGLMMMMMMMISHNVKGRSY